MIKNDDGMVISKVGGSDIYHISSEFIWPNSSVKFWTIRLKIHDRMVTTDVGGSEISQNCFVLAV